MTAHNETPRSNRYAGMLASMPQLATMFGEMVTLERELAAMTGAHAAAQDECRSLGAIIDESQDERDAYRSERNEARAARNELAIRQISFGGAGLARLEASATLGNVTKDLFASDVALAQVAAEKLLKNIRKLKNETLFWRGKLPIWKKPANHSKN